MRTTRKCLHTTSLSSRRSGARITSETGIKSSASVRFSPPDTERRLALPAVRSLKLNKDTVQFFFKAERDGSGSFPLFTEAIRFCAHRESMARCLRLVMTT